MCFQLEIVHDMSPVTHNENGFKSKLRIIYIMRSFFNGFYKV
ncbi:hypothetical protein PAECIP112173_01453 [Paenibacillus sp. JJ-100]|nr:hypothetical protein PAECIP112173_01453 [Paenibacillus sp. JJ-100]